MQQQYSLKPAAMADKAYQIVVLGATGFVGKLVMLHIAETPQYAVSADAKTGVVEHAIPISCLLPVLLPLGACCTNLPAK